MSMASLGKGMREMGGQITGFGLDMLKLGMSEAKAKKIQDTLQEYENWLNTQDITPEEHEAAMQTAKTEAVAGAEEAGGATGTPAQEARPATRGPAEIGLSLLKGEAPPATGSVAKAPVSTELAPGQPLTKKPISRATVPYSQRMANLETAISGPQGQAYRKKITEAGGSQADISTIEERPRTRITKQGAAALEKDLSERELDIKDKLAGIQKLKESRLTNRSKAQEWFEKNKIRISDAALKLKGLALRVAHGEAKSVAREIKYLVDSKLLGQAMLNSFFTDEDGALTAEGATMKAELGGIDTFLTEVLAGKKGAGGSFSSTLLNADKLSEDELATELERFYKGDKPPAAGAGKSKETGNPLGLKPPAKK